MNFYQFKITGGSGIDGDDYPALVLEREGGGAVKEVHLVSMPFNFFFGKIKSSEVFQDSLIFNGRLIGLTRKY